MHDFREEYVNTLCNGLVSIGYEHDQITEIKRMVLVCLDNYELSERVTELSTVDSTTDNVLQLFAGSLLTEGKSKKTVEGYLRIIKSFCYDVEKPILEVTTIDVKIWLAKREQSVSLRTAENYRSYLSSFYRWAKVEELIDKNPMEKIKPIKYTEEVMIPFSDVEVDSMRLACKGDLRRRAELEMLLSSGVRVSELAAMTISDIDFQQRRAIVREGKGDKQRITYFDSVCSNHLKKYLRSRKDNFDCLFAGSGRDGISSRTLQQDLKIIGEKANVSNCHPHRCRRTFASNNAKKGMDIRTIQILMGHSDINTTMGYIHLSNDHTENEYRKYN